jgi:hypothetical protein
MPKLPTALAPRGKRSFELALPPVVEPVEEEGGG